MTTATHMLVRLSWRVGPADRPATRAWERRFYTARLADGGPYHPFGVFLTLGTAADADLELLAPDLLPDVVDALAPGRKLVLISGTRPLAECEILPARD